MRLPLRIEELTPEWLTGALRSGTVDAVSAERVGVGRGFAGVLARLRLHYADDGDPGPRTVVAKLPSTDPAIREYAGRDGMYRREALFYRELASVSRIPVPACYFSGIDEASGAFVLLLEDLSELREGDEVAGCSVADASLAIRSLGSFHAAWWNSGRLSGLTWLARPGDQPRALQDKYTAAWNQVASILSTIYPAQVFAIAERLGPRLAAFLQQDPSRDRTLNHGDFHLGNLFFRRDGVVAIDWQNVMAASPARDVAYFVQGSLGAEDRRRHEMAILDEYRDALAQGGVSTYSRDALIEDYRRGLLGTLVPSVLSVANLDMDSPEARTLVQTVGARMIGVADWDCGELIKD